MTVAVSHLHLHLHNNAQVAQGVHTVLEAARGEAEGQAEAASQAREGDEVAMCASSAARRVSCFFVGGLARVLECRLCCCCVFAHCHCFC